LKFISTPTRGVRIAGGAIASLLHLHPASRAATKAATMSDIKLGHEISDAAIQSMKAEILVLKQERDRLEKILKDRKTQLNEAK